MNQLFIEKIKTQWKKIREKMSTFDAYFSKGLELYDKKKYALAVEFFKIALSQSNAEPYANYNLALTYQKLNKPDEAIQYYEKFIEKYPQDQSALYNTALIYFEKEDYKHAANYFYKSFKLQQDKSNIQALTQSYLKMDRLPKVMDLVDYIFNSNCDNNYAYEVAKLIESQNATITNPELLNYPLNIYLKLLEESPNNFDLTLATSIVYAKKGDWANAIKYCEKALEINPKSFEANNHMGFAYYCAEDFETCLHYYDIAFKINPKTDYSIYSNLAYAYEKMGRTQDAIKMFKELITKFPDFPTREEVKNHAKELIKNN